MKRNLILAALALLATLANAQDIAGNWQGTLDAAGTKLRLVLHISKAPDNSLKATLDSLDQKGANGIPVSSVSLKDSKLSLGRNHSRRLRSQSRARRKLDFWHVDPTGAGLPAGVQTRHHARQDRSQDRTQG
jgi:hypothetical protein